MSYSIFISHKHEQFKIAVDLAETLCQYTGNSLSAFVSGRDISGGKKWDEHLKEKLKESDLLILIYTDPSLEWTGVYMKPAYSHP